MRNGLVSMIVGGALGALAAVSISSAVQANTTILFSGSGSSGTTLGGMPFSEDQNGGINFGIPGNGDGTTPYEGGGHAIAIEINFTGGGAIDASTLISGCSSGGTNMCSAPGDQWTATILGPPGSDSILFTAPPGVTLSDGEAFFFNVFFTGSAPTGFNGAITSVPEPAAWAMMIAGMGLAGVALRRRQRLARAA